MRRPRHQRPPSDGTAFSAALDAMSIDVLRPLSVFLDLSRVRDPPSGTDRATIFKTLRDAATTRVHGLITEKRRSHYASGAALVVCCLELGAALGRAAEAGAWLLHLRQRTSR
jgi:hypothetical protein